MYDFYQPIFEIFHQKNHDRIVIFNFINLFLQNTCKELAFILSRQNYYLSR